MNLAVWLLGLAAVGSTLAGGMLALRLHARIRLITGLSAGAVVGVALFDLVPESFRIGEGTFKIEAVMLSVGVGFAVYMLFHRGLERLDGLHAGTHLNAASLTVHSMLDGLGIGLAFKVSPQVGQAVAIAVLAHDLCDGVNVVTVALGGKDAFHRVAAKRWLGVNAFAPLVGIALSTLIPISPEALAPLSAMFAGVFLYIGASELLPKSHSGFPSLWTSATTGVGMMAIYGVVRLST